MPPPLSIPTKNRTLVQIADEWPKDEGGWATLEGAWSEGTAEPFCNDVGSASILVPVGRLQRQGDSAVGLVSVPELEAKYVRICRKKAGGVVASDDGTEFTPDFVGLVVNSTLAPAPDSAHLLYRAECVGILALFDQVMPPVHFAVPQGTSLNAAEIGSAAIFNMIGNRATGNMSEDVYEFPGGYQAHVFDNSGDGKTWTAIEIVKYIIAVQNACAPGGPTFTVGGQTTAIQYSDKFDLKGQSALEQLSTVMGAKRGVGFKPKYNVGTSDFTLDVMSLAKDEIAVPGGSNVPANDRQKTVELNPTDGISEWSISQRQAATYDRIVVEIAPPQYIMTFSLADFEPDWTADDLLKYNTLTPDDPARDQARAALVGRRFRLRANWAGTGTSGFSLPNDRITETSDLHGQGGWTGEQIIGSVYAKLSMLKLLKNLPMPDGYDWTVQDPTTVDKAKAPMKPVLVVRYAGSSAYTTLADYCGMKDVDLDVESDESAITIGPAKVAEHILDLIGAGDELYITLGVESQMATMVSWVRPTVEMPRDKPRIIVKKREKLKRRFLTPGTTLGVEDQVLQRSPGTMVTIEDDLPLAKTLLGTLIPWYSVPEYVVTSSRTTAVDDTTYETGDLLTEASYRFVDGNITVVPLTAVVTGVSRDYTGTGKLSISTRRINIDVEAVHEPI